MSKRAREIVGHQAHRIQKLDELLRRGTPFTAESLAREWGVASKTVSRDLGVLREECGDFLYFDFKQNTWKYSARMVKTFLLRRIRKLEMTDRPFVCPADFDPDAYLATAFDGDQSTGPVHHVKLRFVPEAAQYGREFVSNATQKITEQPDGSVLVEFDTGALYRVEREVLVLGRESPSIRAGRLRRAGHEINIRLSFTRLLTHLEKVKYYAYMAVPGGERIRHF